MNEMIRDESIVLKKDRSSEPTAVERLRKKMIVIHLKPEIPERDRRQAGQVLDLLNDGRRKYAFDLARSVLERNWIARTRRGTYSRPKPTYRILKNKRRRRLDQTVFHIREACSNNEELIIPELTAEEKREYCESLIESVDAVFNLYRRIK